MGVAITMNSECSSEPVRVGLVGACGRMGQMLVKRILATEGMTVSAAFDLVNIGRDIGEVVGAGALGVPVSDSKDLAQVLKDSRTDVLLDFTIAKATAVNAPIAAEAGVNLIIGTTGLSDEVKQSITDAVVRNNVAAVISTNYSIGVAVFNKLIRQAALLLGNDYDVEIIEAHHNQKQDAPSGTAMTAAEIISEAMGGKDFVYGRQGVCPRGKEIGIHAIRGGRRPHRHVHRELREDRDPPPGPLQGDLRRRRRHGCRLGRQAGEGQGLLHGRRHGVIPKQIKGAKAPVHSNFGTRIFDTGTDVPDV